MQLVNNATLGTPSLSKQHRELTKSCHSQVQEHLPCCCWGRSEAPQHRQQQSVPGERNFSKPNQPSPVTLPDSRGVPGPRPPPHTLLLPGASLRGVNPQTALGHKGWPAGSRRFFVCSSLLCFKQQALRFTGCLLQLIRAVAGRLPPHNTAAWQSRQPSARAASTMPSVACSPQGHQATSAVTLRVLLYQHTTEAFRALQAPEADLDGSHSAEWGRQGPALPGARLKALAGSGAFASKPSGDCRPATQLQHICLGAGLGRQQPAADSNQQHPQQNKRDKINGKAEPGSLSVPEARHQVCGKTKAPLISHPHAIHKASGISSAFM